jgi:DNA-binding CsgD family transcriptional regulator
MGENSRWGRLAGRADEQKLLLAAFVAARSGVPSVHLVHGEAGVGKTSLVREMCDAARARGFTVLWGRCVRLGTAEASYYPILRALNQWAVDAPSDERARVLGNAASVEDLARVDDASVAAGGLFTVLDSVISAIAERNPTVLVVDDLQWADLASRDALTFLIAGLHRQPLVVLATYRDEDLVVGDSLHGWLADARRMPGVGELELSRLSKAETQEQLAHLLGRDPAPTLVDEVMARSLGNAYLSELLVTDLAADVEHLPPMQSPAHSTALTDALLARWHQLSGSAREVMRMLAIGGRPVTSTQLADVAYDLSCDRQVTAKALLDAAGLGVVVASDDDAHWFRHPLLGELLAASYSVTEAAPVHAAWARALTNEQRTGVDELQRQGDLALHFERSQQDRLSLDASLRAADLAEEIHAVREVAEHLQRAARLWPRVYDEEGQAGVIELLERSARASRRVGDGPSSLAALERALEIVDADRDRLLASRLMTLHAGTSWFVGVEAGEQLAELRRAVELSSAWPDSSEHVDALVELASSEAWVAGELEPARRHAEEALSAARLTQSSAAMSWALLARAYAGGFDAPEADDDTSAALTFALEGCTPEDVCWAYLARHNFLVVRGGLLDQLAVLREGYDYARETAELSMVAQLAGSLGHALLTLGRLDEAAAVIREGLARPAVANAGAAIRLAAILITVRTGQLGAAELHRRRAEELIPHLELRPALEAPPILAELELARGRSEPALRMLEDSMQVQSIDYRVVDEMLMWGASAAADLAEGARDRRDPAAEHRAHDSLDRLLARRGALSAAPFEALSPRDLVRPALQAIFAAEQERCLGTASSSTAWQLAVERCEAAGMRWQAETSRLRLSRALVVEGAKTSVVASHLRVGHRFCLDVAAVPLQRDLERLAQGCGVDLAEPSVPAPPSLAPPFDQLTGRESEVLTYLVAGRTYAEIADALVISEKTVSTHVSHLLRKTGTRSRRELAVLFQRSRLAQA